MRIKLKYNFQYVVYSTNMEYNHEKCCQKMQYKIKSTFHLTLATLASIIYSYLIFDK